MNADFELELAALPGVYRRKPTIARQNRRLAPALLWLARPGDALLVEEPWDDALRTEAARRGVELLAPASADVRGERDFAPWGWTPGAVEVGRRANAVVEPPPVEVVARVSSKLFSHALERELGIAVPGAAVASTPEELDEIVARGCPGAEDKWVVKSPMGLAARERVLGRGPRLDPASAVWCERRFARGEALLFEPWLSVTREYGVPFVVSREGDVEVVGVADLLTNGAGAAVGYMLGRPVEPSRLAELHEIAEIAGERLFREGYVGPAGVDAVEHERGFRPLLEINARYTMGFAAVAAAREIAPREPVVWSPTG